MPERLDRITVTTTAGPFELSWESRQALLAELRDFDSAAGIVKAFRDVGASRPVTLSESDRETLVELLDSWSVRVGRDQLPARIADLRDAITDDTSVLYKVKRIR